MAKEFKICSKCPSPAKCKAAGKCLMKGSKRAATGLLVIPVSMGKTKPKKGKKG
jgi:hypothetical protein